MPQLDTISTCTMTSLLIPRSAVGRRLRPARPAWAPPRGSVPSHTTSPGPLQHTTATADLPPPLQEKATLNNKSYQRLGRYSVWLVAAHNCILASIHQWEDKRNFG